MLKYGSLSSINTSNSKSLISRNLTFRQQDVFKTPLSAIDIIETLSLGGVNLPSSTGGSTTGSSTGGTSSGSISANSGNFSKLSTTTFSVDLIKQKTGTKSNLTINSPLNITDLTNVTEQTYSYFIGQNSTFEGSRLDINVDNITLFSEELITFMSPVQMEDKLNLSSSLKFDNIAQIQIKDASFFSITDFSNNILWTIDTSKNNFLDDSGNLIFQDKLNLISSANQVEISTFSEELITFMPPVQMEEKLTLLSSLKFVDTAQIQIKDASSFSITDFSNNILWTIDTSKNNFFDGSGNLIFQDKLNLISSATQFEISTFSEELITFMSPVQIEDKLNLSSSLRFDNTAQIQIKDASSFSITDFSNNILWTIDTSKNNFFDESGNLIFPKSNPDIIFQDKLNLTSSANQFIDINPLITYNVQNCSELKYLANIQVNPYNLSHNIFLRNILSVENRNNTFSGKIISKDFDGLIMSMTFQGYTTWNYSINTVTYFVNQMISPTPQWNIVGMEIVNSFDLKITLSNPQNTETSWNISIESISI